MEAPHLLEGRQLIRNHVEGQRLRARLGAHIVAVAHIDRARVELLLADDYTSCPITSSAMNVAHIHSNRKPTEDEVVLRDFAVADLLWERVLAVVDVDEQPELRELLRNLGGVLALKR